MDVRPIRTEADYQWALREIAPYFDVSPALGSPEADRFDVLATLIEAYEDRDWSTPHVKPADYLRAYMDLRGLTEADLATAIDSSAGAVAALSGERPLPLEAIARLRAAWGIPLDPLVPAPAVA